MSNRDSARANIDRKGGLRDVDLSVSDVAQNLRLTKLHTDARSADVIERNMLTSETKKAKSQGPRSK